MTVLSVQIFNSNHLLVNDMEHKVVDLVPDLADLADQADQADPGAGLGVDRAARAQRRPRS